MQNDCLAYLSDQSMPVVMLILSRMISQHFIWSSSRHIVPSWSN